uniref:Nucleotide-diphospho-sugar transferase domain-containing protein n=1 Tax=Calcidiscus leptoporus TaxID=127549 RepID=A0A7S0JHN5_9EUKA|mmetsp:Transcript_57525/g.132115  ORF Transcript_57525/g.132115 Transcript_57525/m.132115 type:complete len:415 (+) Transcript_57525:107-1351(+)
MLAPAVLVRYTHGALAQRTSRIHKKWASEERYLKASSSQEQSIKAASLKGMASAVDQAHHQDGFWQLVRRRSDQSSFRSQLQKALSLSKGIYHADRLDRPDAVLVTVLDDALAGLFNHWGCRADALGLRYLVYSLSPLLNIRHSEHATVFNSTPHGLTRGLDVHGQTERQSSRRAPIFGQGAFNMMSAYKFFVVRSILAQPNTVRFVWIAEVDIHFIVDPWPAITQRLHSPKCHLAYQPEGKQAGKVNVGFFAVRGSAEMRSFLDEVLDRFDFVTATAWMRSVLETNDQAMFNDWIKLRETVLHVARDATAAATAILPKSAICALNFTHFPTGNVDPNRSNFALIWHANFRAGGSAKLLDISRFFGLCGRRLSRREVQALKANSHADRDTFVRLLPTLASLGGEGTSSTNRSTT